MSKSAQIQELYEKLQAARDEIHRMKQESVDRMPSNGTADGVNAYLEAHRALFDAAEDAAQWFYEYEESNGDKHTESVSAPLRKAVARLLELKRTMNLK